MMNKSVLQNTPSEPSKELTISCPICQKPAQESEQPFCSSRCRDVDLHRWFSGHYAVPTDEKPDLSQAYEDVDAPGF